MDLDLCTVLLLSIFSLYLYFKLVVVDRVLIFYE
jgi:hypothetical protein